MKRFSGMFAALIILVAPAATSAAITSDLSIGSKGPQVIELQNFLIAGGFLAGSATGNYFSLTQKAVKAFQKAHGIAQTGTVGPKTRAALQSGGVPAAAATSTTSSKPDPLQALQDQAKKLMDALNGQHSPTSTIAQVYATSTTSFEFDQSWHDAVVNIFCTDRFGGGLSSGSGVIIDPRGVILTNAHVAIDMLFQNWPNPSLEECVVRTGGPASPQYKAAILYYPKGFVEDAVAKTIPDEKDVVYGKDDYALLLITGPAYPGAKVPASFPYLPIESTVPGVHAPLYLDGYASEFASYEMLQRNLYQVASFATVALIRPVGTSTTADIVAIKGNIANQHGSSGGAVIDRGGKLAGLMTFFDADSVEAGTTGEKVLNAITTDYIQRDFQHDTGMSFSAFLSANDLKGLSDTFLAGPVSDYQKAFAKWWRSRGQVVPGYYE